MYKLLLYSLTTGSSTSCLKFVYSAPTLKEALKRATKAARYLRRESPKTDIFMYGVLYERYNGRNKYVCHIAPLEKGMLVDRIE